MHLVHNTLEIDRDDFAAFYEATEAGFRAYARRCVSDACLADDLVQESYVRLLTSSKATIPPSERKLYLYRIATNLARDYWRKNRRYEPWTEVDEDWPSHPQSFHPGHALDVRRALQRMPARYQALLWLAYIEEYDHKEIAEALNVSRLSVKVMLFRGRKMLAKLLEEEI
jgi:RNA polymerase sigma factor (sigma-70 family)